MRQIQQRIANLDPTLFGAIDSMTSDWDRRALLALHEATASRLGSFNYLEIGSFLGGSLQVVMRDPRCRRVLSIDPRPATVPDKRTGDWSYGTHTTADMLALLRQLPGADLSKLTTFEVGTDILRPDHLPFRPDCCFIDGEHTDAAALRDARFCSAALGGTGIIAFHDWALVKPGICDFLRESWHDVSYALAFTGLVFALEFGDLGILRSAVVDRAVASRWHALTWRLVNGQHYSASPLLAAWSTMPSVDRAIFEVRMRCRQALAGARRD